jgi:hypothetical protein
MANRWKGNLVANAATSSGTDYTGKANGAWSLNSQLQQKQSGLWAKGVGVPSAPTGVSAGIGNAQSVVSFTAPTNTGGHTITGYAVTSSPEGITATGTSSPITITGLTNGTAYTFTVTANNDSGTGATSSPSNSVTPSTAPVIGDAFQGGFFGGKINDGGTIYYLVVAPKATGQASKTWGVYGVTTGITSTINGPANTNSLNSLGASYEAAQFCKSLTINGYADWYLPAKNELEVLYYFLKPTTTSNNTSSGANPNAVAPEPINTNYTTDSPAQTNAVNFKSGGSEAFIPAFYKTSTEFSNSYSCVMQMQVGNQDANFGNKAVAHNVRAIRRVPV